MCLLLFTVYCLLSTAYAASLFDPRLTWRTIPTEHFRVHYSEGLEELARLAGAVAEEVHDDLTAKMGWTPRTHTHLILTDNSDFANGLTSIFPYPTILIFAAPPTSEEALDNYDNWIHTLLVHEYTHVLMLDMTGGIPGVLRHLFGRAIHMNSMVPEWWAEGVPTYEETTCTIIGRGKSTYTDMVFRAAILEDKFPSPGRAGEGMIKWPAGETSYLYGVGFVSYLAGRFGEDSVRKFLRQYSRQIIPFRMNGTARRIFGHNMKTLWADWEKHITKIYERQHDLVMAEGIVEGKALTHRGYGIGYPVWSPNGRRIFFLDFNPHRASAIRSIDVETNEEAKILGVQLLGSMDLSPDGQNLAYTRLMPYSGDPPARYYLYTDIYIRKIEDKKKKKLPPESEPPAEETASQPVVEVEQQAIRDIRLTVGERASDPSFSPDGEEIAYISRTLSGARLKRIGVDGENMEVVWNPGPEIMLDTPRWSPEGTEIALSVHTYGGLRDIYIIDLAVGAELALPHLAQLALPHWAQQAAPLQLMNDRARDVDPAWSPDGRYLLFSSDRSGIPNIFAYDVNSGDFAMVTNVLTGAFQPAVSPDLKHIVYRGYSSRGYDLFIMPFDPDSWRPVDIYPEPPLDDDDYHGPVPLTQEDRRYNPLPSLMPRYLMPIFWYDGVDFQLGLSTGGLDPLREHTWAAMARWGGASQFLSWGASYLNNQLGPGVFISFQQYSVSYGEILLSWYDIDNDEDVTINELYYLDEDYFESRSAGAIGVEQLAFLGGVPLQLTLAYGYEERNSISDVPFLVFDEFLPDEGAFSGFEAAVIIASTVRYPYSISPELGLWFRAGFEWLDGSIGSDFDQRIYTGDLRGFVPMPWLKHHVLAVRAAGGIMEGDKLYQGTFRVGGTLGESVISSPGPKFLSLRGFGTNQFVGDRALVLSGEYRFPIAYPEWAPGLWPIFFQKVHGAIFADYGGAFNRKDEFPLTIDGQPLIDKPIVIKFADDDEWNLGVGAEIRVTGIVGWGLIGPPVTGRAGVAMDVQGDGIGPVFYLDLGTPF